ncbi:hypothetical protein JXA34_03455, partial [Patescibacteria group bacterium]|nr:hypothetical protein [Patescibacteria group bacterium]
DSGSVTTSGAYLIGVNDEFTYSDHTRLQAILKDIDTQLGSGSSKWTDLGSLTTLTNQTDNLAVGGSTPQAGLYFTTSTGSLSLDNYSLFYNGSSDRLGIGTSTPQATLDIRGDIFTDRWAESATNTFLGIDVVGGDALISIGNSGIDNTAIGYRALYSASENSTGNTALGSRALFVLDSGYNNVAIGRNAMSETAQMNNTVAIGANAGVYTSAAFPEGDNVYIGSNAGYGIALNYGHTWNTAVGSSSGYSLASSGSNALYNTFLGGQSGYSTTGGDGNVALGYQAGYNNSTGQFNVFAGLNAGVGNSAGNNNIAIGYYAGRYNRNGSNNVAIGYEAGRGTTYANKSGDVFLGYQAGYYENNSNRLYIENSNSTTPLIWGDFANDLLGFYASVGIGTTNPTNKLQVVGNVGINSGYDLHIGNIGLGDSGSATTSGAYLIGVNDDFTYSDHTRLQAVLNDFDTQLGADVSKWTDAGTYIFAINASSKVGIENTTGYLGLGTTNPDYLLDVGGTGALQALILNGIALTSSATKLNLLTDVSVTSAELDYLSGSSMLSGGVLFANGTNFTQDITDLYWNNASDYLGIGTSNPQHTLDIAGTARLQTSKGYGLDIAYDGSTYARLGVGPMTAGLLDLFGPNNEPFGRFTVGPYTSSYLFGQYFGIGTTSPAYTLDVGGEARFDGALRAYDTTGIGFFDDGGNLGMWVEDGGNVGVGTTNPGTKFEVAGDLTVQSGNTLYLGNIEIADTTNAMTFSGSLLPSSNDSLDLGSTNLRWRDLFLGPGSIHIGTSAADEYVLSYNTTSNFLGFNYTGTGQDDIIMDSNGFLGIGTDPLVTLHIFDTTEQLRLGYDGTNYTSFTVASDGELTVADSGTDVAKFDATGIDFEVPTSFNAAGDVSMAYDLVFTHDISSNILSDAPLTIASGESFNNDNLTLKAHGTGEIVIDNSGLALYTGEDLILDINDSEDTYFEHDSTNNRVALYIDGNEEVRFNYTNGSGDSIEADQTISAGSDWDLAETYPTFDDSLTAGMIVSLTSSDMGDLPYHLVKAEGPKDKAAFGVLSTDPGIVMGSGSFRSEFCKDVESLGADTIIEREVEQLTESKKAAAMRELGLTDESMLKRSDYELVEEEIDDIEDMVYACTARKEVPVALSGRVPVKVSPNSEPIMTGDLLTVSDVDEGKAMKATSSDQIIIGRALNAWGGKDDGDSIMAVVGIVWDNSLALGETTTITDTLAADLDDVKNNLVIINELLNLHGVDESTESASEGLLAQMQSILEEFKDLLTSLGLRKETDEEGNDILTIETDMNVLSDATFNNVSITGDLTLGMMRFDTLNNALNVTGPECYNETLGFINTVLCEAQTLFLQKELAGNVNFFDGKVVFEPNGDMRITGKLEAREIQTEKLNILGITDESQDSSLGQVTLSAGMSSVEVATTKLNEESLIFLTPVDSVARVSYRKHPNGRFEIYVEEPPETDLLVNWWIVN